MSSTGEVLAPLDTAQVEAVLDQVAAAAVESLAVCLLFSFVNPAHEELIGRLASARGLNVSTSSEILPEYREFERTSTTVLNAYVSPLMARYLAALEAGLENWKVGGRAAGEAGVEAGSINHAPHITHHGGPTCNLQPEPCNRLWIMQSSGGILSAGGAAGGGAHTAFRAGSRRRGRVPCGNHGGLRSHYHLRHGRHIHRCLAGGRRDPQDRRGQRGGVAGARADARRTHRGRGRRLDRLGRRRGRPARGTGERGQRAGSCVLRSGRNRLHGHRCQPAAGTARSPAVPGWSDGAGYRSGRGPRRAPWPRRWACRRSSWPRA